MLSCCDAWLPAYSKYCDRPVRILYFVVLVSCRRKKFTFAISSSDELLVLLLSRFLRF